MSEVFHMPTEPMPAKEEPQRFATYAELGRSVKKRNPGITYDDEKVGRAMARRGDYIIEEDPHWANRLSSAIAEPFETITGASESLFGSVAETQRQAGMGVVSGASLGASGYASDAVDRIMGNPNSTERAIDENSMAFAVGELIGEIAGPYKAARGLFGRRIIGESGGWKRRILAGASEAGAVEGGKAMFDTDRNVLGSAAVGFLAGGVGEGTVTGVVGAGRRGIERLIKPGAGEEISTRVVDFLTERGMPVVPTIARPFSNAIAYIQEKATRSAAAMARVKHIQSELHEGLGRAKSEFINSVGGNAALKSPLVAGRALYHRVTTVGTELRQRTRAHYQELADSEIGTVDIDPNMKYARVLEDGTIDETDLWGSLRFALGDLIEGKKPRAGTPAPLKTLRAIFNEARAKHAVQSRTRLATGAETRTPPPWEGGPQGSRLPENMRSRPNDPDFAEWQKSSTGTGTSSSRMVPRGPSSGTGRGVPIEEDFIPLQSYNYWWGVAKSIGDLMETSQYKKNRSVKRRVDAAYHAVQDAIDFQASRLDPNYETSITTAREVAKMSFAYRDMPIVQAIEAAPDKYRSAEMIDRVFQNTESMLAAKRALGPADFEQARQAWLRNVLDRALEISDADMVDAPTFKKLWQQIAAKGGGQMDSEFMKEMFSDANFFDPITGAVIPGVGGADKRVLMTEFYDQFRTIDSMMGDLTSSGEAFGGAGTERGGLASFIDPSDLAGSLQKLRLIAFQLVSTARLADEYFKPPDENIFIYKAIPEWQGNINAATLGKMGSAALERIGISGGSVPTQISSGTRQAATSAGLSRIFND